MTDARIGPTQGVHIKPSERPTKNPDQKPSPGPEKGVILFAKKLKVFSINICVELDSIDKPINATTKMEKLRRILGDMLKTLTKPDKKRVKKVKLAMKPKMVPICFLKTLFSEIETDRTIGKTGKIQGERMVTMPAKNE